MLILNGARLRGPKQTTHPFCDPPPQQGCGNKIRPVPASGPQRAGILVQLGLWCALTTGRSVPGSTVAISPLRSLEGHMGVGVGVVDFPSAAVMIREVESVTHSHTAQPPDFRQ